MHLKRGGASHGHACCASAQAGRRLALVCTNAGTLRQELRHAAGRQGRAPAGATASHARAAAAASAVICMQRRAQRAGVRLRFCVAAVAHAVLGDIGCTPAVCFRSPRLRGSLLHAAAPWLAHCGCHLHANTAAIVITTLAAARGASRGSVRCQRGCGLAKRRPPGVLLGPPPRARHCTFLLAALAAISRGSLRSGLASSQSKVAPWSRYLWGQAAAVRLCAGLGTGSRCASPTADKRCRQAQQDEVQDQASPPPNIWAPTAPLPSYHNH